MKGISGGAITQTSVKSLAGLRVGFKVRVIEGFSVRVSVKWIGLDLELVLLVDLGLGSVLSSLSL